MTETEKLIRTAFYLSLITIAYNVLEGIVSVFYGLEDDTLALLGFGLDSFVEVISGTGIAHMVWRMKRAEVHSRDGFERQALRITGFSFYLLSAGLLVGSAINLYSGKVPETTLVGIIVSTISILTMWWLMLAKRKVGRKLKSDAILSDANCTRTCLYLSIVLLASSLLYEGFRIGFIDVLGSLGIAWFAFREGREAFGKARGNSLACSCGDDCHS